MQNIPLWMAIKVPKKPTLTQKKRTVFILGVKTRIVLHVEIIYYWSFISPLEVSTVMIPSQSTSRLKRTTCS